MTTPIAAAGPAAPSAETFPHGFRASLLGALKSLLVRTECRPVPADAEDLARRMQALLIGGGLTLPAAVSACLAEVARGAVAFRGDTAVGRCLHLERQAAVLHRLVDLTRQERLRPIAREADERAHRAREVAEAHAAWYLLPAPDDLPRTP